MLCPVKLPGRRARPDLSSVTWRLLTGPERRANLGAPSPKHLAERILTSRSALEGERKQVTVLFVDVSGFASLSERLDPEGVQALMTRGFELMLAEVHRYEGTVYDCAKSATEGA